MGGSLARALSLCPQFVIVLSRTATFAHALYAASLQRLRDADPALARVHAAATLESGEPVLLLATTAYLAAYLAGPRAGAGVEADVEQGRADGLAVVATLLELGADPTLRVTVPAGRRVAWGILTILIPF